MKYILVIALLLGTAVCADAQSRPRDRRRAWADEARGLTLFVKTAPTSSSSYFATGIFPVTVEAEGRLKGKFSWVAGMTATWNRFSNFFWLRDLRAEHDTYSLNARVAWVSNRWRTVFFRAELGLSGVLSVTQYRAEDNFPRSRFFPCFALEMYLGFRLGKRCELMIAPLVIAPSSVRYSPRRIGGNLNAQYLDYNYMPIALGIKF